MKVGFIGLGIMGKPMATHLVKAGYELYVHNRSRPAVEQLAELGAHPCEHAKETAEKSDIVITMLPDSPDVDQVVLGTNGVAEGLRSGGILIDMSSIDPQVTRRIGSHLKTIGVNMLDAPVSGGEIGAIQGTLAIMVGGDEDVYQKCLPILETMGKTVTRVGELGAGNTVKLMNQIIVAVHIIAMSEAFALGKKSGIHLERAYTAIKDGLAGSRVLDTKINNILSGKFQPGFRVELHAKDLRNAIKAGEAVGVRMPFTLPVLDMFEQLINEGHHDKDHSILYQLFS